MWRSYSLIPSNHSNLFYHTCPAFARFYALSNGKGNKHSIPLGRIKIMEKQGLREVKEIIKKEG
jgi:hypothetical protein